MFRTNLQLLTAWLCLTVVFLTGLSPAQGFVFCIEQDGCVQLEVRTTTADCGGCDDHQVQSDEGSRTDDSHGVADCSCVDIALPGPIEQRQLRQKVCDLAAPTALIPVSLAAFDRFVVRAPSRTEPRTSVPRPSGSLALIRTVVLRV